MDMALIAFVQAALLATPQQTPPQPVKDSIAPYSSTQKMSKKMLISKKDKPRKHKRSHRSA